MPEPLIHVVLHEPEIPNNTGTIGRTCVALGFRLHLIRPLGFDLSEKARRRAGLDYWPRLDVVVHDDWGAYVASTRGARRWLFTTAASRPVYDAEIRAGDHLVFGKETAGLPRELIEAAGERAVTIPMRAGERSMNLACAATAGASEALRQLLARGAAGLDGAGRIAGP